MALIPKIKACLSSCSGIIVNDITGFYNAISNINGWLAPNLLKTYTGTATLKIVTPSGNTIEVDVKQTIEDSIFPQYTLYTYEPDSLVDGIYKIYLTLVDTDNTVTYKASTEIAVYCNVECCVNKLAAEVSSDICNGCSSDKREAFNLANELLESLSNVVNCLGEKEFNKLLSQLQKLCNSTGCGC